MLSIRCLLMAISISLSFGSQAKACAEPSIQCALAPFQQDEFNDLHSVVVIEGGSVIFEHYYSAGDQDTLIDVRSAGKSVTAIIMGIALDKKIIGTTDDRVVDYWAESEGASVGKIRLDDLLTMRTGLDADADDTNSFGYEDHMDEADDPMAFALSVPSKKSAGKHYTYNSLAAYMAGIVIGQAAGVEYGSFAQKHFFDPLKIHAYDWNKDRSGITKGQGNLFLKAKDFARIGQLVLDGGVFEGQRVVSARWIKQMLTPRVDISRSSSGADFYGYYWYQKKHYVNGHEVDVWFASGNGGNKIYLVPDLNLVVTVMSDAYGQGRAHGRAEKIFTTVLAYKLK